jgi:cobalt/nickel transport system permease protein
MDSTSSDSRGRLLAVLLALAVIGSEALGEVIPFALYGALVLAAVLVWRAPVGRVFRRVLHLTPVLLLIAAGLPLSRVLDRVLDGQTLADGAAMTGQDAAAGVSLLLRTLCAAGLLIALSESLGWQGILHGLRGLGLPVAVTAVLEHLERYRSLIVEEWRRTCHARESRSPGGQRFSFASYAGQTGMVFLRSWDRSERIHQAMMSRGYSLDGELWRRGDTKRGSVWAGMAALWLPAVALVIRTAL